MIGQEASLVELIESLWIPLGICLLLAGTLVYFGIHIIARRVIFVDLALAQLTALGAVYAEVLGWDIQEGGIEVWLCSFAAGVLGAAFFSVLGHREEKVPREATVGIVYVVAMAATILVGMNLPHGMEHASDLLKGSILWISGNDLLNATYLFAGVGAFHLLFRRRMIQASFDPDRLLQEGGKPRLWNFLFYCSFAVVVASSVSMAGVLLVFAYLVMPAVLATMFANTVRGRLLLGWAVGGLVSAAGLYWSYENDLPSGPTIVLALALALCLGALVRRLR
jgi:zinc/manganese transport system permease protein